MLFRLTLLLLAAVLFANCDKDVDSNCTKFRNALVANDEENILRIVNQRITQSFLLKTSQQNLEALAKHFSEDCKLEVKYICFECVETNPPMSEISIQFLNGVNIVERTIDFADDRQHHRMKAINVH